MERHEFLLSLDEVVELEPGTLKGDEKLEDLDGWNSLAVISFIALADEKCGISLQPSKIANCKTIADLIALLGDKITQATTS
jgi:acyl carrier protein